MKKKYLCPKIEVEWYSEEFIMAGSDGTESKIEVPINENPDYDEDEDGNQDDQ